MAPKVYNNRHFWQFRMSVMRNFLRYMVSVIGIAPSPPTVSDQILIERDGVIYKVDLEALQNSGIDKYELDRRVTAIEEWINSYGV